jgi:hypothetical protein
MSVYSHHNDLWIAITHALTYDIAFALRERIAFLESARDRSQPRCRWVVASETPRREVLWNQ